MQRDNLREGLINETINDDREGNKHLVFTDENREEGEGQSELTLEEYEEIQEKEALEKDVQDELEVKKFIQLKEGVSWWNASNIFFTYFISISQIVFFDLCLVYLLKSESHFNIPTSDVAGLSANIVFYSQPFTLLFDIILGYMHDKLGRKVTLLISNLICVLAFAVLPFVTTIYPGLLLIRIMLNFSVKGPLWRFKVGLQ